MKRFGEAETRLGGSQEAAAEVLDRAEVRFSWHQPGKCHQNSEATLHFLENIHENIPGVAECDATHQAKDSKQIEE